MDGVRGKNQAISLPSFNSRSIPPFKDRIEATKAKMVNLRKFFRQTIEEHKRNLDLSNPNDFIDAYLAESAKDGEKFNEEQLVIILLDLFLAGSETTSKSMAWAMLCMAKEQEVRANAVRIMIELLLLDRPNDWLEKNCTKLSPAKEKSCRNIAALCL